MSISRTTVTALFFAVIVTSAFGAGEESDHKKKMAEKSANDPLILPIYAEKPTPAPTPAPTAAPTAAPTPVPTTLATLAPEWQAPPAFRFNDNKQYQVYGSDKGLYGHQPKQTHLYGHEKKKHHKKKHHTKKSHSSSSSSSGSGDSPTSSTSSSPSPTSNGSGNAPTSSTSSNSGSGVIPTSTNSGSGKSPVSSSSSSSFQIQWPDFPDVTMAPATSAPLPQFTASPVDMLPQGMYMAPNAAPIMPIIEEVIYEYPTRVSSPIQIPNSTNTTAPGMGMAPTGPVLNSTNSTNTTDSIRHKHLHLYADPAGLSVDPTDMLVCDNRTMIQIVNATGSMAMPVLRNLCDGKHMCKVGNFSVDSIDYRCVKPINGTMPPVSGSMVMPASITTAPTTAPVNSTVNSTTSPGMLVAPASVAPTTAPVVVNGTIAPTTTPGSLVSPSSIAPTTAPVVINGTVAPTTAPIVINGTIAPTTAPASFVGPSSVKPTTAPIVVNGTTAPTTAPASFVGPSSVKPTTTPIVVNGTTAPTTAPVVINGTVAPTTAPVSFVGPSSVQPTTAPIVINGTTAPTTAPVSFVGPSSVKPTTSPIVINGTTAPTTAPVSFVGPSSIKPTTAPIVINGTTAPTTAPVMINGTFGPTDKPVVVNGTIAPKNNDTIPPTVVNGTVAPRKTHAINPRVPTGPFWRPVGSKDESCEPTTVPSSVPRYNTQSNNSEIGTHMCFECTTSEKMQKLACDNGEVIVKITSTSFGNPQGSCFDSNAPWTSNKACHFDVVDKVGHECLNKQSCMISADPKTFGAPCSSRSGDYRLMVNYMCARRPSSSVQCFENKFENPGKKMTCPKGHVIHSFPRATFGVQQGSCSAEHPWKHDRSCTADARETLMRLCGDRESCFVEADAKVFGKPCDADASQFRLMADYVCKPAVYHETKCFNSADKHSVMRCPRGSVITGFNKGSFGNPMEGCSGHNGNCHVDPLPILMNECLKRDRCDVNATASVFGIPVCGNTTYANDNARYHLVAEYTCGPVSDTWVKQDLTKYNATALDRLKKKSSSSATAVSATFMTIATTVLLAIVQL